VSARFRTIVADPPWHYERFARNVGGRYGDGTQEGWTVRTLPYGSMTVDQIKTLPVKGLADRDCRLFLWTTNRYLRDAFDIATAWGFGYRQMVVWHKTGNPNPWIGHIAPNHAEFLLVCSRGKPERLAHLPSNVLAVDANPARLQHSQKPDAFLDYIERVSPGPYAELFARRARLGWSYPIGDQALGGAAA
jgi:N6-adenosine-specific RNA methylase IME4